jgi:hypothetical protein
VLRAHCPGSNFSTACNCTGPNSPESRTGQFDASHGFALGTAGQASGGTRRFELSSDFHVPKFDRLVHARRRKGAPVRAGDAEAGAPKRDRSDIAKLGSHDVYLYFLNRTCPVFLSGATGQASSSARRINWTFPLVSVLPDSSGGNKART